METSEPTELRYFAVRVTTEDHRHDAVIRCVGTCPDSLARALRTAQDACPEGQGLATVSEYHGLRPTSFRAQFRLTLGDDGLPVNHCLWSTDHNRAYPDTTGTTLIRARLPVAV